jgi:tetratricopeptide (TPR) repeat protein
MSASYSYFVGRHAELRQWDEILRDPLGQAILIIGPPGIGKSSLLDKMFEIAEGHPDVTCGAVRYDVTPTDSPDAIMELMMDQAFDAATSGPGSFDLTEQRRAQWRALLKVAKIIPAFGDTAEAITDLVLSLKRDPRRNTREQFLARLRMVSRRMSKDGRAVFIVDPEKSLMDESADSWRLITQELPPKIKLIFAQRSDDCLAVNSDFNSLSNVISLPRTYLNSLDEASVRELAAYASSVSGFSEKSIDEAFSRYSGHPFALHASITLLTAGLSPSELPTSPEPTRFIQDQWKQLASKGAEAIRLLQAYAVLGIAAADYVVEAVALLSQDARKAITADNYVQSLLRHDEAGTKLYHTIVVDFIYGQMTVKERGPYHQRAVEICRRRIANRPPDSLAASRLSYHVQELEGIEAAVNAFVHEASPVLLLRGDLGLALSIGEQLLGQVGGRADKTEAAIRGVLGTILARRGELGSAEAMFTACVAIDQRVGDRQHLAVTYNNLGNVFVNRGELASAEDVFRKALAINEKLGLVDRVASQYGNLGIVLKTRGDLDDAGEMYRRSIRILESLGQHDQAASQYGNLGTILRMRGDLDGAEQMFRQAMQIDEERGRREGVASQLGNLGILLRTRGELDEAEKMHGRAIEVWEEIGNAIGIANESGNLGLVLASRGDLAGAESMLRRALGISENIGHLEGMASQYGNLGNLYWLRRDYDEARSLFEKALAINEQIGRVEGIANQLANLGNVAAARGDLARSEELHKRALVLEGRLGRLEGIANENGNLGNLAASQGDLDRADEHYQIAIDINERLGRLDALSRDYANLGNVRLARGDLVEAERLYEQSLELCQRIGRLDGAAYALANIGIVRDRKGVDPLPSLIASRRRFAEVEDSEMVKQVSALIEEVERRKKEGTT